MTDPKMIGTLAAIPVPGRAPPQLGRLSKYSQPSVRGETGLLFFTFCPDLPPVSPAPMGRAAAA